MWHNYHKEEELTAPILFDAFMRNPSYFTDVPGKIEIWQMYACDYRHKIIYLSANSPSIISALHEFGHYKYGRSELKACRFSVHLFKEIFPIAYKKLKWEGHMLK